MTAQRQHRYTSQEYLELERAAHTKSEFHNGEIFSMAGTSRAHSAISVNLTSAIHAAFVGQPCRVFNSDLRVKIEALGIYTYPDISAICEDERFDDDTYLDTLLNPLLLVEVLSPSTEAYDRGRKFASYQLIPSLQEYVLVSQNEARIESYRRQADGQTWLLTTAASLDSKLALTSISIDLTLAEVYDKVTFLPATPILHDDCGSRPSHDAQTPVPSLAASPALKDRS